MSDELEKIEEDEEGQGDEEDFAIDFILDLDGKDDTTGDKRARRESIIAAIGRSAAIKFDRPRKLPYLLAFAETGNGMEACRLSKVSRVTVFRWIRDDPKFAQAVEVAREIAADVLGQEAWSRAVDGWREPVFQGGQKVGEVLKKSDYLLSMLLRGAKPDVYAKKVEVSGSVKHEHTVKPTQTTADMLNLAGDELLQAMKNRILDIKLGRAQAETPEQGDRPGVRLIPAREDDDA